MNKRMLVVHHSRYGASAQYAHAIAEALDVNCKPLKSLKKKNLDHVDTIVYGAGVYVSKIRGLSSLNKRLKTHSVNTYIFAVGLDENNAETVKKLQNNNEKELIPHNNPLYYFNGNFDVDKLGFLHRGLMRVLKKVLSKKEAITKEEQGLLNAIETPVKGVNTSEIYKLTDTL